MFKGIIIENSLTDKSILKDLDIEKTWQEGDWVLHSVKIEKEKLLDLSKVLDDGPWYIHLWETGKDEIRVIFKDKIVTISSTDKSTWQEAISYGKSIGIPEEQLDFPIE